MHFWPATFLALGFPILMTLMTCLTITWLLVCKKVALVSIVGLLGLKNLQSSFGISLPRQFTVTKPLSSIRIATWKVERFRTSDKRAEAPDASRREISTSYKK